MRANRILYAQGIGLGMKVRDIGQEGLEPFFRESVADYLEFLY